MFCKPIFRYTINRIFDIILEFILRNICYIRTTNAENTLYNMIQLFYI